MNDARLPVVGFRIRARRSRGQLRREVRILGLEFGGDDFGRIARGRERGLVGMAFAYRLPSRNDAGSSSRFQGRIPNGVQVDLALESLAQTW